VGAPDRAPNAPVDAGAYHLMRSEMARLMKMADAQLKDDVRCGLIVERPDGKVLEIGTREVERLSKKSILEAYGKEKGETVLDGLRDAGALMLVSEQVLRAK